MKSSTFPAGAPRLRRAVALALLVGAGTMGGTLLSTASMLSGCVLPTSTSDAGDAAASSIPTVDTGTIPSGASGTGCGSSGSVTLCVGTTACPSISVDQSVYPECGFYFPGSGTYLVCLCSNYLCPIGSGAVDSCTSVASILASSNEGTVCGGASEGTCTAVSSGTTTDGGSGSTDTGTCDENCAAGCGGVPDCIQLCGC